MSPRLVDTHCHLYLPGFAADLPAVLARARQSGVERILIPGIDLETSRAAVEMADTHDDLFAAVGIHPHHADQATAQALRDLEALAHSPKVRAIGEIGLDFYRNPDSADVQLTALEAQLEMATRLHLPVVLHSRQALETLLPILEAWSRRLPPVLQGRCGVLHAFGGDPGAAARATRSGFYLGAGGPITYPSAKTLRATLAHVSPARLLIETDAPYLPPQAHRGQRNEPAYVRYVAEALGELTLASGEDTTEVVRSNAAHLFAWNHGSDDAQLR